MTTITLMTKNEQRAVLRKMVTTWNCIELVDATTISIDSGKVKILIKVVGLGDGVNILNYWVTESVGSCGVNIKYPVIWSRNTKLITNIKTLLDRSFAYYKLTGNRYEFSDSEIPF